MTLTLYNTLTRKKEPFRPIDPANVRMYVCGPTVYDYAHIGNARPVIVFDVLFRLLRHIYGADHVTYARNITDVDDKINARAAEQYPSLPLNEAIRKVTEATTRQFHEDIAALGVLPPTYEPRATEYIRRTDGPEDMVRLIETLVRRGHAYVAEEHVLFDVSSMPDYGRLANRSLEEMESGARVEVAPYKKGPMDFVLWKPSKAGEPSWLSPCGIATPGRPGWHIECSAMAGALLGETFDIHGGGIDLVFPHHENEVAQSRCAHGTPLMANVWMHNGFLQVEGEKMSKSLGNFVTIRELLQTEKFGGRKWDGSVLRLAMLMTHYRQPINWTVERLHEADTLFSRLLEITSRLAPELLCDRPTSDVVAALEDDLNTPAAIAALAKSCGKRTHSDEEAGVILGNMVALGLATEWSVYKSHIDEAVQAMKQAGQLAHGMRRMVNLGALGHFLSAADAARAIAGLSGQIEELRRFAAPGMKFIELERILTEKLVGKINSSIVARALARETKNFKEADRIRDELGGMGIQLKDAKNPTTGEIETTWEVKR